MENEKLKNKVSEYFMMKKLELEANGIKIDPKKGYVVLVTKSEIKKIRNYISKGYGSESDSLNTDVPSKMTVHIHGFKFILNQIVL